MTFAFLLCVCCLSDDRSHVGVPVHEALHSRGDIPTPSGLLSASTQQLLRLLGPVPPSRCLGRTWSQPLLHLLRGLPPDELLQLPRAPQVSRIRTNVLLALLSRRTRACNRSCFDLTGFGINVSNNLMLSSLENISGVLTVT